ncbi:MAG: hypothetical protein ACREMY_03275, partial [bacterium]
DNNGHGFKFDKQGVRVPAVVASPFIPSVRPTGLENQDCNLIDHTQYDHASLPASLERLLGLPNLTDRDARANDFRHLLSLDTPRTDAPLTLPDAAESGFFCDDDPPPPTRDVQQPLLERRRLHGPVTPESLQAPVTSTMRGFVQLAAIHDARMNPESREAIKQRVRSIDNTGEARAYLDDVAVRLSAHLTVTRAALPRTNRTGRR